MFTFSSKIVHDIYIYIYIYMYIYKRQDLHTVLRGYSLGSSPKIMSCEFFLMGWKCIF